MLPPLDALTCFLALSLLMIVMVSLLMIVMVSLIMTESANKLVIW